MSKEQRGIPPALRPIVLVYVGRSVEYPGKFNAWGVDGEAPKDALAYARAGTPGAALAAVLETMAEGFAAEEPPLGPGGSLYMVLRDVVEWQAEQFPDATVVSAARHLAKEADELAARPDDPEEVADVLMLAECVKARALAVAEAAGIDPLAAVRAKLAKNKARVWGEPNDEGFREHVR